MIIRHANEDDLSQIIAMLNPFIEKTAITFDTLPYTPDTRLPWFTQFDTSGRHQCLVAVDQNDRIIGYANSAPLRPKAAYNTSVEVSVYRLSADKFRGVGSELYAALFERLRHEDVHRAHALITLPNAASIALHKKFDFYEVGTLHEAGRKFNQYHDVYWMEKRLG